MEFSLLKQERLSRGWSRAYVEAKTGIPPRSLENWEGQKAWPRGENIEALCQLYGKTATQLGLVRGNHCGMIVCANQKHENNGAIAISTPEGTNMSEFLKSSLRTDISSQLNSILGAWPRRNLDFEDLQAEIHKAVTDYNACVEYDIAYAVTRRDACKSLMLVPLQLCGLGQLAQTSLITMPRDTEGLLSHCAAGISVCWYMRRGKDLSLAHEIVSWYIPILQGVFSSQAEKYRTAAASLLAQSFMLKGSIAQHLESSDQALVFTGQAIEYSVLAGDLRLEAFTNRMMAQFQYGAKKYEQALTFAERAEALLKLSNLDKLTQSWIYSGLTYCQAFNGQIGRSVTSLKLARDLFDPHALLPAHMQYSQGVLYDCGGIASLRNGNYQEAADFFDEELTSRNISEFGKVQASLRRAKVEVLRDDKERDMNLAVSLWTQGITGAGELGSKHFINESHAAYDLLRAAWPREDAVKKLREYF